MRIVWADPGPRTLKYHQVLDERLGLRPDERALLTVLLLRGPQAPGELRTRTDRLHPFADRSDVEEVLRRMAAPTDERPTPLVRELERRPGQQDRRWVHLLGPVEDEAGAPVPPRSARRPRERAGGGCRRAGRQGPGDVRRRGGDVRRAPRRRARPASRSTAGCSTAWRGWPTAGRSSTCGTGPGHVAAYLAAAGADVSGVDLSPRMVEEARTRFPGSTSPSATSPACCDRRRRPAGGPCTAWYALVHLAGSELAPAVASLARVLVPGAGWPWPCTPGTTSTTPRS